MFKIYHRKGVKTNIFRVTHRAEYCWVSDGYVRGPHQLKSVTNIGFYVPISLGAQRKLDMSTLIAEVDTAQEAYEYIQMYLLMED